MKTRLFKSTVLATTILLTVGCGNNPADLETPSLELPEQQPYQQPQEIKDKLITVNGRVTEIEDGKDGYTATIKNTNGDEYIATISVVNLQKGSGNYKKYAVGDSITVKGTLWEDDKGKNYITVEELQ